MALSVLPPIFFVISAHLFPSALWCRYRSHSSSSDQLSFLMAGFRWLCHRSLHYFPILPGRCSAIKVHFDGPWLSTSFLTSSSSSLVHGLLFFGLGTLGLRTFYQRWMHSTSDLLILLEINPQFFLPLFSVINFLSIKSYSGFHLAF